MAALERRDRAGAGCYIDIGYDADRVADLAATEVLG